MTDEVEIVVFNDKSYVRFTEYQKLQEQIEKMKCCGNCGWFVCDESDKKECGYYYKYWKMRE